MPVDGSDVTELVSTLRRIGGEPASVEVKSATAGLPSGLRETLSAFSNSGGGVILLGIDERAEFEVLDLPDPIGLRNSLVRMARDDITPPLVLATEIVDVEGRAVVAVEVPPVGADKLPVYVTSKGVAMGSYLRAGDDGDRRMSEAEIGLLIANRVQPRYDREAVEGTSLDDLDRDALSRTFQRVRRSSAALARVDEPVALCRLGVLEEPTAASRVTLGGLLAFGAYPQQYFPQLMVSVVVHPPTGDSETRFLDNASVRGSIPEMVQFTLDMVRRNLASRASVSPEGRTDRLEFPLLAVREAVVNALLHRDYSGATRGTQVQVELFPDRLEVRSPGGLYGGVGVDDLGEEGVSSSRNATLASLLSDAYMPGSVEVVAENRASGVPAIIRSAREYGLPRPVFRSSVASFVVVINRSQLLSDEVRRWVAGLHVPGLTPMHEIALAMLRQGGVTNADLRQWGADRIDAGRVLRDLVDAGFALREGGRRYARYVLDPRARGGEVTAFPRPLTARRGRSDDVARLVREAGRAVTAREVAAETGLSRPTVVKHLNALTEAGLVVAHGVPRSPARTYRWAAWR